MTLRNLTGLAALLVSVAGSISAQSQWVLSASMEDESSLIKVPVFPKDFKEEPRLPRVLIIGDSISIGYTPEVRHLLEGKANVYRIPENGATTEYGLKRLVYWLGDGHWAVIHFNFGLHDFGIDPMTGKKQVAIEDYEKNLRQIVSQLQTSGAKLIWASTTTVPSEPYGRSEVDALAYNAVARQIMGVNRIRVDDLHGFVLANIDHIGTWQLPSNVHFRAEGYVQLGMQVAHAIQDALVQ